MFDLTHTPNPSLKGLQGYMTIAEQRQLLVTKFLIIISPAPGQWPLAIGQSWERAARNPYLGQCTTRQFYRPYGGHARRSIKYSSVGQQGL